LRLQAAAVIDPATGWFEIVQSETKTADIVANRAEIAWLSQHPWPTRITHNHGSEFVGSKFQRLIDKECDVEAKPSSKRKPRSNAILERTHQTIGKMLRAFEAENQPMDKSDPWSGILSAAAWAVRSACHAALQSTPGQSVFGQDMIWDMAHVADWQRVKQCEQTLIDKNNKRENTERVNHDCAVGNSILKIEAGTLTMEQPRKGPFNVICARADGTVATQKSPIKERLNIQQTTPHVEQIRQQN
jgi:hypothetical protein